MSGTGSKFVQDIFSSVHITIMHSATFRTNPVPYSKPCDTFRPRIGQGAAIRTGLGCITLVHFFKPCAMPNGLVRELSSEGRPTCIENGLGHSALGKPGSIYVAYCNVVKLAHDAGAEFVVKVVTAIRNLPVYRTHPAPFARPLRGSQSGLSAPIDALRLDFFARGQGSEVFQAKVNAHALDGLTHASDSAIHLKHDIQEPVAPAVAGKVGAVLDFSNRQGATVEHAERVSSKSKGIALALQLPALERNPPVGFLPPVTQVRTFFLAARLGVLLTHSVDRARVQTQLFAASCGQLVQIEPGVPAPAKAQGIFLPVITEAPNEIAGPALLVQQASQRLHPVSVNRNHFCFFKKSSTARRISSDTETSSFLESACNRSKAGSGRKKYVRFIHTLYRQTQQPDSFAAALYLPGLKAGVSREVNR